SRHHPGTQLGRWFGGDGERQRCRHLAEPVYLAGARLAADQVAVEAGEFLAWVQRVKRVGAGKRVQILAEELHQLTPRQSGMRISPSRIRVLMAPSVTFSSSATWR